MMSHGWNKDADAKDTECDMTTTVGFLVADKKDKVILCSSTVHMETSEFESHSRFDCVTAIPKSAVRKMRRLRKGRD